MSLRIWQRVWRTPCWGQMPLVWDECVSHIAQHPCFMWRGQHGHGCQWACPDCNYSRMKRRLSLELVRVPGNCGACRVDFWQENLSCRNDSPSLKLHFSPSLVGTFTLFIFFSLCFVYTVRVTEKRIGKVISIPHYNAFPPTLDVLIIAVPSSWNFC